MSGTLRHWEGEPVEAWRQAWGVPLVEAWARIGSTSDRALELAAAEARPFSVVLADEQTRGRGRRGRAWHSAPGAGLWMSVVLPAHGSPPWLPLLVGLAVAESIEGATGALGVGIKWPNDLMLGGRKVGGILCESLAGSAGSGSAGAVVAGVGVNVRAPAGGFPGPLADTATALDMEGAKSLSRSRLAGLVLDRLEGLLAGPEARLGRTALDALRARDVLADLPVHTEESGPGTARGIGESGALLLERPDGSRVPVSSGSVRPA